jgi:hypothetical protein
MIFYRITFPAAGEGLEFAKFSCRYRLIARYRATWHCCSCKFHPKYLISVVVWVVFELCCNEHVEMSNTYFKNTQILQKFVTVPEITATSKPIILYEGFFFNLRWAIKKDKLT